MRVLCEFWSTDRTITGNFEVVLENTGAKLHTGRQGKCNTQAQVDAVIEQVREYLASVA